jgi:hypothetical protein
MMYGIDKIKGADAGLFPDFFYLFYYVKSQGILHFKKSLASSSVSGL